MLSTKVDDAIGESTTNSFSKKGEEEDSSSKNKFAALSSDSSSSWADLCSSLSSLSNNNAAAAAAAVDSGDSHSDGSDKNKSNNKAAKKMKKKASANKISREKRDDKKDSGDGGEDVMTSNKASGNEEIFLYKLLGGEAPFLVGVKGRNISLIRKFSGMAIYIRDNAVSMVPQRFDADADLAKRMVFSACYGGILRWFETPAATKKGFPDEKVAELKKLAESFYMSIELLRSKRGHMCLMLIPTPLMTEPANYVEWVKMQITVARASLLEALNSTAEEKM